MVLAAINLAAGYWIYDRGVETGRGQVEPIVVEVSPERRTDAATDLDKAINAYLGKHYASRIH